MQSLCSNFIVVGYNQDKASQIEYLEEISTKDHSDYLIHDQNTKSQSSNVPNRDIKNISLNNSSTGESLSTSAVSENGEKDGASDNHINSSQHKVVAEPIRQTESSSCVTPPKPPDSIHPITNICIINATKGEKIPRGWKCILKTPSGELANLCTGANLSDALYLCVKRDPDATPICNIGIWRSGREALPEYWTDAKTVTIIRETFSQQRLSANIANESFIMFKTLTPTAPMNTPVIMDIKITMPDKNKVLEKAPLNYHTISKPLSTGMLSTKVLISYNRTFRTVDTISYPPELLFSYSSRKKDEKGQIIKQSSLEKQEEENWLQEQITKFCLPRGALVEAWPPAVGQPLPVFSTFVLTNMMGEHSYGSVLSFYEEIEDYREKISKRQMQKLNLYTGISDQYLHDSYKVYNNKAICLISKYAHFDAFQEFLCYIYRLSMSVSNPQTASIESLISDFLEISPPNKIYRPRLIYHLDEVSSIDLKVEGNIFQKSSIRDSSNDFIG